MNLLYVALFTFVINLPFGYWRANIKSRPEFKGGIRFALMMLAIHTPIPLIYLVREYFGINWRLSIFPILVGSFFLGQFIGGRIHNRRLSIRKTTEEGSVKVE